MENSGFFAKKALLLLMALAFTSPFALEAISTFKGQLVYLKECRVCHLSSKVFLATHEVEEWEKIFDSDGVKLSDIHLKVDERFVNSKEGIRKSSHAYFKSERYGHGYKELKAFILESAKNGR